MLIRKSIDNSFQYKPCPTIVCDNNLPHPMFKKLDLSWEEEKLSSKEMSCEKNWSEKVLTILPRKNLVRQVFKGITGSTSAMFKKLYLSEEEKLSSNEMPRKELKLSCQKKSSEKVLTILGSTRVQAMLKGIFSEAPVSLVECWAPMSTVRLLCATLVSTFYYWAHTHSLFTTKV